MWEYFTQEQGSAFNTTGTPIPFEVFHFLLPQFLLHPYKGVKSIPNITILSNDKLPLFEDLLKDYTISFQGIFGHRQILSNLQKNLVPIPHKQKGLVLLDI